MLESSSLPSMKVFRVSKSSEFESSEYNMLKCLENTTCFSSPSPVLSRENLSEVSPTFIRIRHSKLDL